MSLSGLPGGSPLQPIRALAADPDVTSVACHNLICGGQALRACAGQRSGSGTVSLRYRSTSTRSVGSSEFCRLGRFQSKHALKEVGSICLQVPFTPFSVQGGDCSPLVVSSVGSASRARDPVPLPWVLAPLILLVRWASQPPPGSPRARTVRRGSANCFCQVRDCRETSAGRASGPKGSGAGYMALTSVSKASLLSPKCRRHPVQPAGFHSGRWATPFLLGHGGGGWASSHHTTAAPTMLLASREPYE